MDRWKTIEARAAKRIGGSAALEAELPEPKSASALRRIPDSSWLAQ